MQCREAKCEDLLAAERRGSPCRCGQNSAHAYPQCLALADHASWPQALGTGGGQAPRHEARQGRRRASSRWCTACGWTKTEAARRMVARAEVLALNPIAPRRKPPSGLMGCGRSARPHTEAPMPFTAMSIGFDHAGWRHCGGQNRSCLARRVPPPGRWTWWRCKSGNRPSS